MKGGGGVLVEDSPGAHPSFGRASSPKVLLLLNKPYRRDELGQKIHAAFARHTQALLDIQ